MAKTTRTFEDLTLLRSRYRLLKRVYESPRLMVTVPQPVSCRLYLDSEDPLTPFLMPKIRQEIAKEMAEITAIFDSHGLSPDQKENT